MTGREGMPPDPLGEGVLGLRVAGFLWDQLLDSAIYGGRAGLARAVGALTDEELRALVFRRLLADAHGVPLLEQGEAPDPGDGEPLDRDLAAHLAAALWPYVQAVQRMGEADLLAAVHEVADGMLRRAEERRS